LVVSGLQLLEVLLIGSIGDSEERLPPGGGLAAAQGGMLLFEFGEFGSEVAAGVAAYGVQSEPGVVEIALDLKHAGGGGLFGLHLLADGCHIW
jgi:hypothetical protein